MPSSPLGCGPECPICYGSWSVTADGAAAVIGREIELDLFVGRTLVTYDAATGTYNWQTATGDTVYIHPTDPVPQYVNPVQWMSDLVAGFRDE